MANTTSLYAGKRSVNSPGRHACLPGRGLPPTGPLGCCGRLLVLQYGGRQGQVGPGSQEGRQLRRGADMQSTQLPLNGCLLVISAIAVAYAVVVYVMERARRRRYFAALQRVRNRTPCSDDEFVRGLGLDRMSEDAETALTIRRVLAESLQVPPEAITQTSCFGRDSDMIPLCDSLDTIEIVLQLEERLGMAIPDEVLTCTQNPFVVGTVGGMIHAILTSIRHESDRIRLTVAVQQKDKTCWVATVAELNGVVVHGRSREDAVAKAKRAALHSIADLTGQAVAETSVAFAETS